MAPRLSCGRGKFDLGQRSAINVTPLVGVMLLLLVVFMLAAPSPPPSVKMEIPGLGDGINDRHGGIFVYVERNKALYIGARPTALETLAADIGAIEGAGSAKAPIMVRAHRSVPYKEVVTVLSTLKQAGYTNVGLVMEDL